uniref:Uncharacterized protein n=1 Tax=viral metagenome TaxID=1070528 RepID=A0A6C0I075_9ZZZZ
MDSIQLKYGRLESVDQNHKILPLTKELLDYAIEDVNKEKTYIFTELEGYERRVSGGSNDKIKGIFNKDNKIPHSYIAVIDHKLSLLFEHDKVFFCKNVDTGIFGKYSSKEQLFIFIPSVSSDLTLSRSERKRQRKEMEKAEKEKTAKSKGGKKKKRRNNKTRKIKN